MLDLESVLFDEKSSYWTDIASENLVFLKKSEDEVTGLLQIQGYLSLCDLYDVLGLDRYVIDTRGGEPGWVRGIGFVDDIYEFILDDEKMSLCCSSPFCCGLQFGIFDTEDPRKRAFVNGYEPSILLNITCY